MAQEQQPVPSLFLPEYPLPQNQLFAELNFIQSYSGAFPHAKLLVETAIGDIAKIAGTQPADGMNEAGPATEPTPLAESKLLITMPEIATGAESRLTTAKELQDYRLRSGYTARDDFKIESVALLRGLYILTGAETVRDDRNEAETTGLAIRRGRYDGKSVYFVEHFAEHGDGEKLQYRICSEAGVDDYLNALRVSEREEFLAVSGLDEAEYEQAVKAHEVTSQNYHEIAEELAKLEHKTRRLGRITLTDEIQLAVEMTKAAMGLPLEAGKLCVSRMFSPLKRYIEEKR